jgi:hypothetical protein
MSLTLYDATVPSFLQTLGAVSGVLEQGLAHGKDAGLDPESLVEARIAPDMLPLRFQAISVMHHSAGALDGVARGVFSPPPDLGPLDYAGLRAVIADAQARVSTANRETLAGLDDREVEFRIGERTLMRFKAPDFLLSFSLPNFYFHATTLYDILRMKGAPLGKRNYLGAVRVIPG